MNSGFSERFGPGDPVQLNQSFNFNSIISSIQRSTQNQHLIFNYLNGSPNHQSDPDGNIKVKRTRQRVDAGQPRSTIPVYNNLMRSAVGTGKGSHPYLTDDMSLFKRANIFGTSDSQRNNSSSPSQHNYMMNQMVSQMNGNSFAPQGKAGSVPEFEPEVVHRNSTPVFSNDVLMTQLLRLQGIMASSAATTECKPNVAMKLDQEPAESPVQSIATDLSVGTWHQNESTPPLSTGSTAESAFHFCAISTSGLDNEVDRRKSLVLAETSPSKSKRKQYLPRSAPQMILENNSGYEIEDNDDVDFTCYGAITGSGEPPRRKQRLHSQDGLLPLTTGQFPAELESLDDVELKVMQQEITDMQQRYMQLLKTRSQKNTANVTTPSQTPGNDRQSGELMSPGFQLNSELITNVESTVDKVVAQYLQMVETARLSLIGAKQTSMELQQTASTYPNQGPHEQLAQSQKNLYLSYYNALALYANATSGFNGLATATAQSTEPNGIFPLGSVAPKSGLIAPIPFGVPTHAVAGSGAVPVSTSASSCFRTRVNSVGALPLLPKNRKSKVTDSRSSKGSFGIPYNLMATSQLSAEETFTQVGCDPRFQTRPSISPSGIIASPQSTNSRMELENSDMEGNGLRCVSDGSGSETGSSYLNHSQLTSTLTPTHLRKAKLMFFYVRYPTSQILKSFFPDIRFDKNNTAQLVKWFSNFREFYYIQMEKYARQALAEGIRSSDEITVDVDSELYRVLNVHYNRNNHIQVKVPADFREVVEVTLREFFKSIQANRDAEQSWKKSIYKIIARLDQTIPVYFNTMSFMQQLGFSEQ